jgi:uncharacterized protein involved in exopolysaccharide biosynthesis
MLMNQKDKSIDINDVLKTGQKLFKLVLEKWLILAVVLLFGGGLGFFYAYIKKPIYTSTLSFIINENEGGVSGSLSSLAGLAGFGGMNSGGNVNEDKLLFISTSRHMLGSVLLSDMNVDKKSITMADYFIDLYKMRNGFEKDSSLRSFVAFKNTSIDSLTYQENKIIDKIIDRILKTKMLKVDGKKKTGIVSQSAGIVVLEFKCNDEDFGLLFTQKLYQKLSTYYVSKIVSRQARIYGLIQNRADSLSSLLRSREAAGASYVDQNVNLAKMTGRLNVERARKDIEMLSLMYAEVVKNLEMAKFNLDNQTPVLQIIDSPTYPLPKMVASKIKFSLLGGMLAFGITLMALFIRLSNK